MAGSNWKAGVFAASEGSTWAAESCFPGVLGRSSRPGISGTPSRPSPRPTPSPGHATVAKKEASAEEGSTEHVHCSRWDCAFTPRQLWDSFPAESKTYPFAGTRNRRQERGVCGGGVDGARPLLLVGLRLHPSAALGLLPGRVQDLPLRQTRNRRLLQPQEFPFVIKVRAPSLCFGLTWLCVWQQLEGRRICGVGGKHLGRRVVLSRRPGKKLKARQLWDFFPAESKTYPFAGTRNRLLLQPQEFPFVIKVRAPSLCFGLTWLCVWQQLEGRRICGVGGVRHWKLVKPQDDDDVQVTEAPEADGRHGSAQLGEVQGHCQEDECRLPAGGATGPRSMLQEIAEGRKRAEGDQEKNRRGRVIPRAARKPKHMRPKRFAKRCPSFLPGIPLLTLRAGRRMQSPEWRASRAYDGVYMSLPSICLDADRRQTCT